MRPSREWLLGASIAAIVAAASIVWFASDAGEVATSKHDESEVANAGSLPPIAQTDHIDRLPDIETPLSETIDQLRSMADAGSVAAACRLGAEAVRCVRANRQVSGIEAFMADRARQVSPEARQNADATVELLSRSVHPDELHCAGAKLPSAQETLQLWRKAALGEHPQAMVYYSSGAAINSDTLLELSGDLSVYAREAEAIALRAAKAGNSAAILTLARAYSPEGQRTIRSLLAQATGANPSRALALYEAYSKFDGLTADDLRLIEQKTIALKALMTEEEIEVSRRELEELAISAVPGEAAVSLADFTRRGTAPPSADECESAGAR